MIGAGSAGAVIANRLTEEANWKVLLLEAGGDETFFSQVPAIAANIQLTKRDWQYKTTPQENGCLVSPDKRYGQGIQFNSHKSVETKLLLTGITSGVYGPEGKCWAVVRLLITCCTCVETDAIMTNGQHSATQDGPMMKSCRILSNRKTTKILTCLARNITEKVAI